MNQPKKFDASKPDGENHRFPALDNCVPTLEKDTDACVQFRPMFPGGSPCYSPALPSRQNNEVEIDPQEKEKVRQSGFQKGFEAGQKEAGRSVREAIEPSLIDFLQALENVSAFHQHLTETASQQIILLALKICDRILSGSMNLDANHMDEVRGHIQELMTKENQLNLAFGPDDLAALQNLMASFKLALPESEVVAISSTDPSPEEKITVQSKISPEADIERFFKNRLPELLANAI